MAKKKLPQPKALNRLPAEILRERLRRLRESRGWSQDELTSRANDYDAGWVRSTVAKIELGQRQVTINELVMLAFVLGVSPVALITSPDFTVEKVTHNTTMGSSNIWRWMMQRQQSGGGRSGEARDFDQMVQAVRFYEDARPNDYVAAGHALPGLDALLHYVDDVESWAAGLAVLQMDDAWAGLRDEPTTVQVLIDTLTAVAEQAQTMVKSLTRQTRRAAK